MLIITPPNRIISRAGCHLGIICPRHSRFLCEADIEKLRPLLLNTYLPSLNVVVAQDENGEIHGFLGTDANRIEMLFVDAEIRGKGTGKFLLNYAVEQLQADELDVNEQNPQGVGFTTIWVLHRQAVLNWMGREIRSRCCT